MAQQHLKFAIFGNEYQAKKSASIMQILSYLEKREAEVYIESLFYDFLTKVEHLEVQAAGVFEDYNFDVDIKRPPELICTPKVRHFWGVYFYG